MCAADAGRAAHAGETYSSTCAVPDSTTRDDIHVLPGVGKGEGRVEICYRYSVRFNI